MISPHWRKCSAEFAPLWAGITCAFSIAAWHSSVRHTFAKPLVSSRIKKFFHNLTLAHCRSAGHRMTVCFVSYSIGD